MAQKKISYIPRDELERRSQWSQAVLNSRQHTCPSAFNSYEVDNYTEIRAPQNNPYGIQEILML